MFIYCNKSKVEEVAREKSGRKLCYSPTEKIGVIEVPDFPSLGKITALRFIEWMQLNPEGLICLPTGKTPEYFIKWTIHYLNQWYNVDVQKELASWGIDEAKKPDMRAYTFVQIDEFYPMNPDHENSFRHYINHFYFKGFGLDPKKALLLDTWTCGMRSGQNLGHLFEAGSVDYFLRFREPISELERLQIAALVAADEHAMVYESKIQHLGGIGFFLGGIGPDGHIGFNVRGSDHFSTTRVIPINYETAASAATDLGGIELARQRLVITIGLNTITKNESATAIIIAAGESKAVVVRNAVENTPSVLYPATSLQKLDGARFYLTQGATHLLMERKKQNILDSKIDERVREVVFIDAAYKEHKKLAEVSLDDLKQDFLGSAILEKDPDFDCASFGQKLTDVFKTKIKAGNSRLSDCIFLHTAPHHDDIMLGYLPYVVQLVRDASNTHYFATMTSGFTSVSNEYTKQRLAHLKHFLPQFEAEKFVKGGIDERNSDIYEYLDGIVAINVYAQQKAESSRLLRDLMDLFSSSDLTKIKRELESLKEYFEQSYPGKKDIPMVQKLKGMIREWEEELWWGHLGFDCHQTFHMRLGFYTGDIFTPQPEMDRDILPVVELLEKTNPDVVTVAMDPEASGPDTHYKVLQGVAQALKIYLERHPDKKVTVWGYRNVWYRFHPAEADLFVPVSMNSFAILKNAFNICFGSQRSASFPSYEYDGPFSHLAQKIMVENYDCVKNCLGRDYFQKNSLIHLRAAHGICFIKSMNAEEFFEESNTLKKQMELREF
jgi:glucosamine-6-phosphate deaminase